ncbi:DUF4883 family protein [uncultured Clostridium sp.]|jgi:hypothetical protein|uniref:DUF4883 family protein n=1 Tax=uncultured Clostridium sp. TaxID=59620 RepID=UPI002626D097|nr:DUF4883 family protein [uncultured Clostridium sp.]
MKKFILFSILSISLNFISCSTIEYSSNKNKPSESHYSESLKELITTDITEIKLIENKFYKEVILDKNSTKLISDMVNELDLKSITLPLSSDIECLFKLHIKNNTQKYVIDVYGNDIISIYPWDGVYEKDFLDISSLPLSLKAESICNFILKN